MNFLSLSIYRSIGGTFAPRSRPERLRRNIAISRILLTLISSGALIIPIVVPLWQSTGMTVGDGLALQSLFAIAVVVLETPTGYLADLASRRLSLILSGAMMTLGGIFYFFAEGFWGFFVGEIFFALGISLASGADQALLYDTLKELGEEERYASLWGRAVSASLVWMSLCGVAAGLLGAVNLRLPVIVESVLFVCMCVLALFIEEPLRQKSRPRSHLSEIIRVAKDRVWDVSEVRGVVLFSALLGAFLQMGLWCYPPYFTQSGVGIAWFGVIFTLLNLGAACGSRMAGSFARSLSVRIGALVSVVCVAVSYLLMGSYAIPWGFLFLMPLQFIRGTSQVVYSDMLHRLVDSDRRATVVSVKSMCGRGIYALLLLPFAWLVDEHGVQIGFIAMALVTVVGGVATRRLLPQGDPPR